MRRLVLSLALLVVALVPSPVAADERCRLTVSPAVVTPDGAVDLAVTGVPTTPAGGVELGIDVRRLGTHEGSAYALFVWPGVTEVSLRHHYDYSGENPLPPLEAGRYLVRVTTPHVHGGCQATGMFRVAAD